MAASPSNTDDRTERAPAVVPLGVWMVIAAAILALGLALHSLFPRYAFETIGASGDTVLVFDRWTGQFQRATYGPDGEPRVTSVVKPF